MNIDWQWGPTFHYQEASSINLPCRYDSLISNIEHIAFMTSNQTLSRQMYNGFFVCLFVLL